MKTNRTNERIRSAKTLNTGITGNKQIFHSAKK